MKNWIKLSLVLAGIGLVFGCDPPGSANRKKESASQPLAKRTKATPRPKKKKRPRPRRLDLSTAPTEQRVLPRLPDESEGGDFAVGPGMMSVGLANADAEATKALALIDASLKYNPTLVVWLLDDSPSAAGLRSQVAQVASGYYQKQAGAGTELEKDKEGSEARLLTAVVTFGPKVQFSLAEPTSDSAAIVAALTASPTETSSREMGFSAVHEAVQRYLPWRKKGREVLLIVATDEAADDAAQVEEVLKAPRKYAIPVYVIGPPAPLGRAAAADQSSEAPANNQAGGPNGSGIIHVRRGPESRKSERIAIELPQVANFDIDQVDSGFGPFGWEWLCRASGGRYLAVRSPASRDSLNQGFDFGDDKPIPRETSSDDGEYPYDASQMRSHAPDYVSTSQYQKILDNNAACMALHKAAQLPSVAAMRNPLLEFAAGDEAAMKRLLDSAQTEAARLIPDLDRLYDFLAQGEKDRNKITRQRWKAGYDLAMGRVLAAKVRVEGYNVMLAALKRGKKFERPDSNTWVLERANNLDEAGGKYRSMAEKAQEYLKRVVQEHPGTPWAQIADTELRSQIGWQWSER